MDIAHAAWLHRPEIKTLRAAFAPGELRFVGGCVRDALLDRPVQDVDAATKLPPEETTARLTQAGLRAIPTGIAHGTVTAMVEGRGIEITTLRRDTACDGRHAAVEYTDDWAEDAKRRDFTVNALFVDASGAVEDYVGGLDDVSNRRLRFIGDAGARVREDYLRILRYYRFGAQLGWALDNAEARTACAYHASGIDALSGERIRAEMFKLLAAPCEKTLAAMAKDGVWARVFLTSATCAMDETLPPEPLTRLAYLALRCGMDAARIAARWRLSNAERITLEALVATPPPQGEASGKKLIRARGNGFAQQLAALHKDDALAALARSWQIPAFPVSGNDLLARGFVSGAALGAALKKLEATWEASDYALSREALLSSL